MRYDGDSLEIIGDFKQNQKSAQTTDNRSEQRQNNTKEDFLRESLIKDLEATLREKIDIFKIHKSCFFYYF